MEDQGRLRIATARVFHGYRIGVPIPEITMPYTPHKHINLL